MSKSNSNIDFSSHPNAYKNNANIFTIDIFFTPGSVIHHSNGMTTTTDLNGYSITHPSAFTNNIDLISVYSSIPRYNWGSYDFSSILNQQAWSNVDDFEKMKRIDKEMKESQTETYDGKSSDFSPKFKLAMFSIKHPVAALAIGPYIKHSTNISTNAARFASLGKEELGGFADRNDGNRQTNAFRHTIWQATITAKYGDKIAKHVGYANEINPNVDLRIRNFTDSQEADQTVDLLNNEIGRSIGLNYDTTSMKELAYKVLDTYNKNGLYTALKTSNGYEVQKVQLNDHQYNYMQSVYKDVDENGKTENLRFYNNIYGPKFIPVIHNAPKSPYGKSVYEDLDGVDEMTSLVEDMMATVRR
ncbi:hypothetical protein XBO1_1630003 [Xenorhabdus bovienii str. oregonense]|uniref:DUF6973 domain-containing protein n=1 Tax=Xenorhabdus bovienii str. oregonense TaxID=1398202 RepID=A0A077NSC6_XENBV|nr:hypothetical protein [Xenorhabdus bovienii]CDH04987.1 hypothetical protein XBO1_1630003 [Xenorhabdus bovienii str. oregonense]